MSTDSAPRTAAAIAAELDDVRVAENRLHARRAALIEELTRLHGLDFADVTRGMSVGEQGDFVERSVRAEVACALRVHEQTAARMIRESRALAESLPRVQAALAAGELSYRHVRIAVEEFWHVPFEARGDFGDRIMRGRTDVSTTAFARRCRLARERVHPEPLDVRFARAAEGRSVTLEHARDGMSYLTAFVPTVQAVVMHNVLTGVAEGERDGGDLRTAAQLRADALCEAILRGPNANIADATAPVHALRAVRASVAVTVPVLTLLGKSEEPGTLDGVGPNPADVARVLAAQAPSFQRILTNPVTGATLAYDRTSYRVPADLKRWLERRDGTCRFPGCSRRAGGCDADHLVAWQHGGSTNADNLAHLCRQHHRLKHHTGWSPTKFGEHIAWQSPAGQTYVSSPEAFDAGAATWDEFERIVPEDMLDPAVAEYWRSA